MSLVGGYVRRRDRLAAQRERQQHAELEASTIVDATTVEATTPEADTPAPQLVVRINGQALPLDAGVMRAQLAEFMSQFTTDLHDMSERSVQARAIISGLRGLAVGALPFLRNAITEQRIKGMKVPELAPLPRRHDPLGHLSQWMGAAFVELLAQGEIQVDAAVTEAGNLAVHAVRFVTREQLALPAPCEGCGQEDDDGSDAPALVESMAAAELAPEASQHVPGTDDLHDGGGYQDITAASESGADAGSIDDQEESPQ